MPSNFLKIAIVAFAFLAISAVTIFNGQLYQPDASELASLPVGTGLSNVQPSYMPTMIVDPPYTSPPTLSSPVFPTPDPAYSVPLPSAMPSVTSSALPSAPNPNPSLVVPSINPSPIMPSPIATCKPVGWFSFWRPSVPCPPASPTPTVNPSPSNCGGFGTFFGLFRRPNCPQPSPTSNLPSAWPSIPYQVGSPSPVACQPSIITSPRPWWAFWLPKVTIKYGKCPSPSPSINPSSRPSAQPSAQPSSQPSQKPSPAPSSKKSPSPKPASDIIRLYIDLGLRSRHDDMEFKNKRATLYWYATAQGERKVSISADNRIKRDQDGYWYIDFTPGDLGEKEIPTANYCVEIAYRFKVGTPTANQYSAATYVTYSDREVVFGQTGVFSYDTVRYGLYETTGLGFLEPTPQRRVFCPTNQPSY